MALVPGTLTTAENIYPAAPQTLLERFASKLTAPPAKKALFSQASSTNIPIDGSALWHNTLDGSIRAYIASSWKSLLASNFTSAEYSSVLQIPGSTSANQIGSTTAPTSLQGVTLLSATINLASTINKVEGRIGIPVVFGRIGAATPYSAGAVLVVAVFRGNDSTAFQTGVLSIPSASEATSFSMSFTHSPTASGNVQYTVKVGVGGTSASTTTLAISRTNDSASSLFAGTGKPFLQLEERI
jgi:hypothetical protein